MSRFVGPLVVLLFAGLSAQGHSQELLQVDEPAPIHFRPFQPLPTGETMRIRLRGSDGEELSGVIELRSSDGGSLAWQGEESIPAIPAGPDIRLEAGRYVIPFNLGENDQRDFPISWRPDKRAFVRPGQLRFAVDIRVLDETNAIRAEMLGVPVILDVAPDTALSIAGTSGSIDGARTFAFIDFGKLEMGERAFIVFGAQANTEVEFLISSENAGRLVSQDDTALEIPYSAWFDGEQLDLKGEVIVGRRPDATLSGSQYRLDVEVGNVAGAFAGVYRDVVTVELKAS